MKQKKSLMRSISAAPHVFWAILFIVLPLLIVLYYAFTDAEGNFSFSNITSLPSYASIFGLSIELVIIATAICLLIGYPLAYIIAKSKPKHQKIFIMLLMLPMWTNLLIRTYSIMAILDNGGILNTLLGTSMKIIGTKGAVIFGMVYDFLPYMVLPIYTCISKIDKMQNADLAALVRSIYEENKDRLLWQSAAKSVHHNKVGELLWHVARMVKMAGATADTYSFIDRDMLLAGVLVHDIGKLNELLTDEVGVTDYTRDGFLFGHALLGIEIVKKHAEKLGTPAETVRCLTHIIASHHGLREYGAIATPATAEAYAVHCIDLIDARMYIFEDALGKLDSAKFSDPIHTLEGTRIYKPDMT